MFNLYRYFPFLHNQVVSNKPCFTMRRDSRVIKQVSSDRAWFIRKLEVIYMSTAVSYETGTHAASSPGLADPEN